MKNWFFLSVSCIDLWDERNLRKHRICWRRSKGWGWKHAKKVKKTRERAHTWKKTKSVFDKRLKNEISRFLSVFCPFMIHEILRLWLRLKEMGGKTCKDVFWPVFRKHKSPFSHKRAKKTGNLVFRPFIENEIVRWNFRFRETGEKRDFPFLGRFWPVFRKHKSPFFRISVFRQMGVKTENFVFRPFSARFRPF